MKKTILAAGLLLSPMVYSMDYLRPMYNPAKGGFVGYSRFYMNSSSYDLSIDDSNSSTEHEIKSMALSQQLEYGLMKGIILMADFDYYFSHTEDYSSVKKESSGIESMGIGARYRLNNSIQLPLLVDVGAMFRPSFQNRIEANNDDEGSVNSGGHDLSFFARTGKDNWYFKMAFDFHFEQEVEDATDGDALYTVASHTSLLFKPGIQFQPMELLLVDVAGIIERTGERKLDYDNGGSATYEPRWDLGIDVQGYYQIFESLHANAGFQYIYSTEQAIDSNNDATIEKNSSLGFNIGASYKF